MKIDLQELASDIRNSVGLKAKKDIASAIQALGVSDQAQILVGDDCAAIPDDSGYTLFAIEGFIEQFVSDMPWFAGYCGVMVNASDVAAMGGRPIAVTDAVWATDTKNGEEILRGMSAAAKAYGIPVVGGHTNFTSQRDSLAVSILGRATALLSSFDARPGDDLIAAIDLRGRWHDPHPFWDASSGMGKDLRGDLELLPSIAEAGLSECAKDISNAGIVGTALMLAECSGVHVTIDINEIPRPEGTEIQRWLCAFPSYGYILTANHEKSRRIIEIFEKRGISASVVGRCESGWGVSLQNEGETQLVWDLQVDSFMGCRA